MTPTADFGERASLYAGQYYLTRSSFTTFEKMLRAMAPVSVQVDANNEVVLNMAGRVQRYVEVEPGLLVNLSDPDDKLALKESGGQVMLSPAAPFAFIKAGPAAALELHMFIDLLGALLFLIALVAWTAGLFPRGKTRLPLVSLARGAGALFGLGYLALLIVLAGQFMKIAPAYGVPALFFGVEAGLLLVLAILPPLLALLAVAMLVFSVLLWRRRAPGRLFYSLLALSALAIVWSLAYWNLLKVG